MVSKTILIYYLKNYFLFQFPVKLFPFASQLSYIYTRKVFVCW